MCSMISSNRSRGRAKRLPRACASGSESGTVCHNGLEQRFGERILRGERGPELAFHLAANLLAFALEHRMVFDTEALQLLDRLPAVLDRLRTLKCSCVSCRLRQR